MINRLLHRLINEPFDFFNDYTDTYNYLVSQGYTSLALHLERRNDEYIRLRETGLDISKPISNTKITS